MGGHPKDSGSTWVLRQTRYDLVEVRVRGEPSRKYDEKRKVELFIKPIQFNTLRKINSRVYRYISNMAKFSIPALALALSLSSANAFVPSSSTRGAPFAVATPSRTASGLSMVATSLEQEQPPLSPLTIWGDKIEDIVSVQKEYKNANELPEFAPEIHATKDLNIASDDLEAQEKYFKDNAMEIKQKMLDNGAVIFRGFDLMKSQEGFIKMYSALGMNVCLDPLHSVSARPTVDGVKNSPVYEAVNKESRKNFFIGE